MKTRRISTFGIRALAYATSLATAPAENTACLRQPFGKSRRLLGGFHLGALRLGNSRLGQAGKQSLGAWGKMRTILSGGVRHAFLYKRSWEGHLL
ncbi:hypothetical protein BGW80DRAFT_1334752 [Lactifluus volemus]|nr:hypothetical protein BGW80DRAFT_1334752 [Lactifluus volemus]